MTNAIVQRSVSFYGDELVAIQQGETAYTPIKPICDLLGLDWETQRERIQADEVLAEVAETITLLKPGDARAYPMLCLPLDFLHGWLFGVQVNRIRPELRERLILYKRECYRVLSRAFGGAQVEPARLAALEARVAALEASQGRQRGPGRPRKAPRALPAPRLDDAAIVAHLEFTRDPNDLITGTEIAERLIAHGLLVELSRQARWMRIAEVLRAQGVDRAPGRRAAERRYGRLCRAWAGVKLRAA